MEEIFKKFDALNKQMEEMRARVRKEGEEIFMEAVKSIFEQHERLISFGWNQYTPYYNDGEECTFSANIDYPYINGYNEDYDDDEEDGVENILKNSEEYDFDTLQNEEEVLQADNHDIKRGCTPNNKIGGYGYRKNPKYDPQNGKIVADVNALLGRLDEDMLKDLFGDHVEVTIHREDGVIKEEYDHN